MLPDIHVHNLSLKFHQQTLFEQLCFTLESTKWITILGASGVGKSTLLQYLAGLIQNKNKTKNTTLDGSIHTANSFNLSDNICYMAQRDNLMPWLSAFDNSLIGYRLRGEAISHELKQHAMHLFSETGLHDAYKKYPQQLSGGMRQRVALIRTLLENRPIVLMDEPFSALDAITRIKLQDLSNKLLKGKTVLLVTHDPLEALRLSDKIYVLSHAPAHFSEAITLSTKTPRKIDEPELQKHQATLFELLLDASTGSVQ